MDLSISFPKGKPINGEVSITGSKSQSNRLLVLQKLFDLDVRLENTSTSDDTKVLIQALKSTSGIVDVHHAGTSMRFLTSYFALKANNRIVLTGSRRMQERPIGILVEALKSMGAKITYQHKKGYPPLEIRSVEALHSRVRLQANTSSQYITSLMLIGGYLTDGLKIELEGPITSRPYIELTQNTLKSIGVNSSFRNKIIKISPFSKRNVNTLMVESDWSSASYHYSLMALSKKLNSRLVLSSFLKNSPQGDSQVAKIYFQLGVMTTFDSNGQIVLSKKTINGLQNSTIKLNLSDTPDLAQTITVTCFGLKLGCTLYGLHTLKIKETNRLRALEKELTKLGAQIQISDDSLTLMPRNKPINPHVAIDTYDDHRMAMAFAPLGILVPITIKDSNVVSKSYLQYWDDLKELQFEIF